MNPEIIGVSNIVRNKRSERSKRHRVEGDPDASTASSPILPANISDRETATGQSDQANVNASSSGKRKKGDRGSFKGIAIHRKSDGGKKKLQVQIPDNICQALGPHARDLANHCGYVVRTTAPIDARSWEDVLAEKGDVMLKQVEEKFELDPSDPNTYKFKEYCEETMHRLFRAWRSRLSITYGKFETDEERWANKPKGLSDEQWGLCMNMFDDSHFKYVSGINSNNRGKVKCKHTTGNLSFPEFEEKLASENGGVKPTADVIWLKEHTKVDKQTGRRKYCNNDTGSEEVYNELCRLSSQSTQEGAAPMTQEDMLLAVLPPGSYYYRGKGNTVKLKSKRAVAAAEREQMQQRRISELEKQVKNTVEAFEAFKKEMLAMIPDRRQEVNEDMEDDFEEHVNSEYEHVDEMEDWSNHP